jgi:hypothetical protein
VQMMTTASARFGSRVSDGGYRTALQPPRTWSAKSGSGSSISFECGALGLARAAHVVTRKTSPRASMGDCDPSRRKRRDRRRRSASNARLRPDRMVSEERSPRTLGAQPQPRKNPPTKIGSQPRFPFRAARRLETVGGFGPPQPSPP